MDDANTDKHWFDSLRNTWVILGGTSLFAALFVLLGRIYVSGYYGAMNIGSERIVLSSTEYAEIGSIRLLLYVTVITGGIAVFYLVLGVIIAFVNLIKQTIKTSFSVINSNNIRLLVDNILKIAAPAKLLFRLSLIVFALAFFLGYTLSVVFLFADMARSGGEFEGRRNVMNNTVAIKLVSDQPLQIDSGTVITSTLENNTYYTYEGLRVLLNNEGRYFLFESIDDETCRPQKVFVVQEARLSSRTITSAPPIAPDCKPTTD